MSKDNNENILLPITSMEEVLDIIEVNDWIVPIPTAAKLLGLTKGGIYEAINRGDIIRVNGVTLESVKGFKVDKKKQVAAKIGQYYKGQGSLIEGIIVNGEGEMKECNIGKGVHILDKGKGDCSCGEIGKFVKELAKKGIE